MERFVLLPFTAGCISESSIAVGLQQAKRSKMDTSSTPTSVTPFSQTYIKSTIFLVLYVLPYILSIYLLFWPCRRDGGRRGRIRGRRRKLIRRKLEEPFKPGNSKVPEAVQEFQELLTIIRLVFHPYNFKEKNMLKITSDTTDAY